MNKAELRKIYLAKQKSLSPAERNQKSKQICVQFMQNFDLAEIKILHCFLPIEKFKEIDTRLIFDDLQQNFPRVDTFVPRVNFQTNEIENVRFAAETKLVKNNWGIHEPDEKKTVAAGKFDLVLIPLLCFDEKGFRVGYGKGFYDRFLKNCRADCLKIGLSYFAPVAEISDAQSFDVRLDFCVTPEKVWEF